MLSPFADEIWIAEGDTVSTAGFHYPTRMILIRLRSGGLFVWSPIALTPQVKSHVDALGPVQEVVAPNALHHLFIGDWALAYPTARIHAAPRLRQKRPDVTFDTDLGDVPDPAWAAEIDQRVLWGNVITDDVVFFHHRSGTVIFTDILQQFPKGWFHGWRAVIARLDLMEGLLPSVPRKFRMAFTKRQKTRDALDVILSWPTQKILMAHGAPITENGQETLQDCFKWLKK